MAYNENALARLKHLKDLGTRMMAKHNTLQEQVQNLVTAGGEPNVLVGVKVNGVALAIADKMVDILIASGTENGTISVAGKDVMVKGLGALAYKAEITEAELSSALKNAIDAKAAASDLTALSGKVTTLIGEDTGKSARTIAAEELAKQLIPSNAKESLDTLAELAAWIQSHPDDATAMNNEITALKNLIGTLPASATATTVIGYIDEVAAAIRSEMTEALDGKVDKADGYRLMSDVEGTKLNGIAEGATKTEESSTNGYIKVNGAEVKVYEEPSDVVHGTIATDTEVAEMLTEVFGA